MQPIVRDDHGTVRFKENAIVRFIVDQLGDLLRFQASRKGRLDVDQLTWAAADREQFAQLSGEKPGRQNAIVRYVVDNAAHVVATHPMHAGRLDLNKIVTLPFPQEDREQFAQLMGYSICGYHELSYVSDESAAEASIAAREVLPGAGGCRDKGCFHGGPLFDDAGDRINDDGKKLT
ncbi:MAG TPA: hypothetical protein VLE97_06415 [Gaiellaceae bacterium]|nr:hypothetical protein [Gaiellaceae bacterium]